VQVGQVRGAGVERQAHLPDRQPEPRQRHAVGMALDPVLLRWAVDAVGAQVGRADDLVVDDGGPVDVVEVAGPFQSGADFDALLDEVADPPEPGIGGQERVGEPCVDAGADDRGPRVGPGVDTCLVHKPVRESPGAGFPDFGGPEGDLQRPGGVLVGGDDHVPQLGR
jgi:hypothetical protein